MANNDMGKRIADRRKELHLSQTQLAELTGYSDKTAISKIENGQSNLTQTKIVIFADALQTTTMYLMGWVDDPNLTKEQVATVEQARRLQAYSNYFTFAVSKRLGHSSVNVTLSVYAHMLQRTEDEMIATIDALRQKERV
mgnify:CR=1 FL=1